MLARLRSLRSGAIEFTIAGDTKLVGSPAAGSTQRLDVLDNRFFPLVVSRGSLGFAEAYIRGYWNTPDLPALLRLFAVDVATTHDARRGLASVANTAQRIGHWLKRNTPSGSRKNIAAHYDLGNDLFEAMLDDTMCYSCGIFESPTSTLREASIEKLDRICRKLSLSSSDRVIEIGTGWGGFAIHAASNYGCHVTSTTISREQHAYALQRVEQAGLTDRITLLESDYRNLSGSFDKLVSIEMIEAVGHDHLGTFFSACSDLLRPGGEMLLQAIHMPDHAYPQYLRNVDFIQRYVFPGSCCPSPGAIAAAVASSSELEAVESEDITPHYVRTLQQWRSNFRACEASLDPQRYTPTFRRMWEYYLAYCEAGFAASYISTTQTLYRKRTARAPAKVGAR